MRFIILLALLCHSLLFASVGKITVVSGQVFMEKNGAKSAASANTKLEESDSVITSSASSAQILFTDGTVITIGANTNFKVHEYLYEEGSRNSNLKVGVKEGVFKAITGKIGKIAPEKFKIEGKTVTIGIRGTKIIGQISANSETVACTKGAITVEPRMPQPGSIQTLIVVRAGEITSAKEGKIDPPRAYTPLEIKKLENAVDGTTQRKSEQAQTPVTEQAKTTEPAKEESKKTVIALSATPQLDVIVQAVIDTNKADNADKFVVATKDAPMNTVGSTDNNTSTGTNTGGSTDNNTSIGSGGGQTVPPTVVPVKRVSYLYAAGDMYYKRTALSVVKLADGRVLALGGFNYDIVGYDVLEPEIYDPATKTWSLVPTNNGAWVPRMGFGATTLSNGKVLVVGGNDGWGWAMSFADLYDATANTWTHLTDMPYSRNNHTVVPLANNKALVVGGIGTNGATNSVILFDLALNGGAGGWSEVTSMNVARHSLSAVALKTGNILVMGGVDSSGEITLNSTEMYNPSIGTWSTKASMLSPRAAFSATVLNDGSVLAIGGYTRVGYRLNSIEQYDPTNDVWRFRITLPFNFEAGSAATLDDGSVLLVGGNGSGAHSGEKTWILNTSASELVSTSSQIQSTYTVGANDGFFIGSNETGGKVFGKINSMLFSNDYVGISTITGELKGALSSEFEAQGYNIGLTNFDFSHFGSLPSGISTAVYYNNEDNKIIWGTALINNKFGVVGFAALPDRVTEFGNIYSEDDYSSWGYWEAATTLVGDPNPELYTGYWVSGVPTAASAIQSLIDDNIVANYKGHVLGDTYIIGVADPIVLNGLNKLDLRVEFGSASPIMVNNLQFETSKGWLYSQSSNLTNGSSVISVNTTANTQGYTATIGNSVNTTNILKLQGKFYGPTANSTGGVFTGALTGSSSGVSSQRNVQGVFKAGVTP